MSGHLPQQHFMDEALDADGEGFPLVESRPRPFKDYREPTVRGGFGYTHRIHTECARGGVS